VALRVARELRAGGVSTKSLRQALTCVKALRNPLAEARLLAIGSSVLWVKDCREATDILKHPGQSVFMFMLDFQRMAKQIETEVVQQKKKVA
jgi:hypothetical protein